MSLIAILTLTNGKQSQECFILHQRFQSSDLSNKQLIQKYSKNLTPQLKGQKLKTFQENKMQFSSYKMNSPPLSFFVITTLTYSKEISQKMLKEYQELFFENIDISALYEANRDLFLSLKNDNLLMKKFQDPLVVSMQQYKVQQMEDILNIAESNLTSHQKMKETTDGMLIRSNIMNSQIEEFGSEMKNDNKALSGLKCIVF